MYAPSEENISLNPEDARVFCSVSVTHIRGTYTSFRSPSAHPPTHGTSPLLIRRRTWTALEGSTKAWLSFSASTDPMGYSTFISVYTEVVLLRIFSAWPVAFSLLTPGFQPPRNGSASCTTQGFCLMLNKVCYWFRGRLCIGTGELTHLLSPTVSWLERGSTSGPTLSALGCLIASHPIHLSYRHAVAPLALAYSTKKQCHNDLLYFRR